MHVQRPKGKFCHSLFSRKKKSSTERKISYNHAAEPAATEASQGPRQVVRLVQAHILGVFSE